MSQNRAVKSGYAKEASEKVQNKFNEQRALIAMRWISDKVGLALPEGYDGNAETTHELLGDGMVLGRLANWVEPKSIKENQLRRPAPMGFSQMELINQFLSVMSKNGYVRNTELFQTVDLYEKQNMNAVIITIEALGRKLVSQGREGFGKAESQGEKREWTEQQLREGQNIIGLQMGTNKGANQSGLIIGKNRTILD